LVRVNLDMMRQCGPKRPADMKFVRHVVGT